MLYRIIFFFFISFAFSSVAYKINGVDFSVNSFYSFVSKSEWLELPSKQKKDLLRDYIYKKLVFIEAAESGFTSDPYFSRKLQNRIDQFLVNVAYDFYVAYPLVDSLSYKEALVNMKPSAYLINTSRGPVVDEDALVLALREGLIAGAALDVYEREPMVNSGLLGLSNVVLSPHLGSATHETRTAMADLAARNLMEVLSGNLPITPINS